MSPRRLRAGSGNTSPCLPPPTLHPIAWSHAMTASPNLPTASHVAATLRGLVPEALQHPLIAIVCGSGLSGLADLLDERVDVPYDKIPGFTASTGELRAIPTLDRIADIPPPSRHLDTSVAGHQSKLSFGKLSGVPVVAQAGRFHFYEGKPLELVTFPIKVFHALGCKAAIGEHHCYSWLRFWSITIEPLPTNPRSYECGRRSQPQLRSPDDLRDP